ncbi:hypothetical protein NECID01_1696 [Nematocida sp. AWRm77]|nr:hypothetical protein NECID01_1696 [Nematocida sp. AWRm77]
MAGVNGYFNGKYISKRESYVILLACVVMLAYGLSTYIVYFAHPGHLDIIVVTSVLNLNMYLFTTNIAYVVINSIIIIEGFLERNLIQIVLTTLVNLIIFIVTGLSIIIYDEHVSRFIIFFLTMVNVLFNLYILFLGFTLRKEFGWFYYKGYGADPKTNMVWTIRKVKSALIRVNIEVVLAFWVFNWRTSVVPGMIYADTAVYYLILLIYLTESRYESYTLRIVNLILCLFILSWKIVDLILFILFSNIYIDEVQKAFHYYIPIVANIVFKIVIMFCYILTLIMDTFSLEKGFHGSYIQKQRRRAGLT